MLKGNVDGQVSLFDQDIASGKTLSERYPQTVGKTFSKSSLSSSVLQSQMRPPCLFLTRGSGESGGATWEPALMDGGAWPIASTMPNFGASRNEGEESVYSLITEDGRSYGYCLTLNTGEKPRRAIPSKLSQILERNPDPKYTLSKKACQGILNRAARRGKELPPELKAALIQLIQQYACRETQSAELTPLDVTEKAGALEQATHSIPSTGQPCGLESEAIGIDRAAYSQGQNAKYNPIYSKELSGTVVSSGLNAVPQMAIPINTMVGTRDTPETRTTFGVGNNGDPQFTISAAHEHAVFYREGGAAPAESNNSLVYDARGYGDGKTCCTLTGDHENRVAYYTALCVGNGQLNQISMAEQATTLDTMHDQQTVIHESVVRRLTPLECERLQGFPDNWTDIGAWVDTQGKLHKESTDSSRYKALGNSIALPFWEWLDKRISAEYVSPCTLGSLFDGIGGFPLCHIRHNGPESVRWASEVEEFPIAVTKRHFGDD